MREDVDAGLCVFAGVAPDYPLNCPAPDGFLHTWAPIPEDVEGVIASLFPHSPLIVPSPTVGLLSQLTL